MSTKVFSRVERVSTSDAKDIIGCSSPTLYRAFDAWPQDEDGVQAVVKGVPVIRRVAKDSDDAGASKWVWTLLPNAVKEDETPAENSPQPSETVENSDKGYSPRQEFEDVRSRLKGFQQKLQDVSEQASDLDVLVDEELWRLLAEQRKEAAAELRLGLPLLGKLILRAGPNLMWLDSDEVEILNMCRNSGLKPSEVSNLIEEELSPEINDVTVDGADGPRIESILVYGGKPRHEASERIKAAFGAKKFNWCEAGAKNRVETFSKRIENGGFETVFALLKYGSHADVKRIKKACDKSGTTFVPVRDGYGIKALKRELNHAKGGKLYPYGN